MARRRPEVLGDVRVWSINGDAWERVIEVRDKPVSREDLLLFASKAAKAGMEDAAIGAFAASQPNLSIDEAKLWAAERGIALVVFRTWEGFVEQALHWSDVSYLEGIKSLPQLVYSQLRELDVSESGLQTWRKLVGGNEQHN